ncbi:transcriptional regulator [Kitasatospora phosalacinea]|uniref:Transcriptional regulator n=1 Tax=Kitasatospora phosalacinea TaxID=2065 RepID=A0A9W6QDY7_9ACTN|nr:helix-turn-helix transcriptional regulator [Kitasatospora phosalacinea]GLW74399.1 transcriptional regulator [Kitasatospora phosalacinea]
MIQDRPVGELLREWRHRRGLSQLDLAIQAGVSARHVSFVETGRTVPSSAMVLRLAEHLAVPLRHRNRLLVAAGHAPVVRQRPLDDPELAPARAVLEQVLRGHEPYPALAVDSRWNLLSANGAVDVFLDGVDPALLRPPVNMMRLGLHPGGFAPRLRNLEQVRAHLLPRLARQAARSGDPELHALHEELLSYGPAADPPPPDPAAIALPVRIDHRGTELCFVNTITTFGAAFDVTLEELAVEAYFPADDTTARFFRTGAPGDGERRA